MTADRRLYFTSWVIHGASVWLGCGDANMPSLGIGQGVYECFPKFPISLISPDE